MISLSLSLLLSLTHQTSGENWKALLKPLPTIESKKYHVPSLAFARDGKSLLTVTSNGLIYTWDLKTKKTVGRPFRVGVAPGVDIRQTALSPDGKYLGVLDNARPNGNLLIWDVKNQKLHRHFTKLKYPVCFAFAPNGKELAIIMVDHVQMFDLAKGKKGWSSHIDPGVRSDAAFSPDGKVLAVGGHGFDRVRMFNPVTGKLIGLPVKINGAFSSLTFTRDSKNLVVVSSKRPIQVISLAGKRNPRWLKDPTGDWIKFAGVSRDDAVLISVGQRGKIALWDLQRGTKLLRLNFNTRRCPLAISPDGNSFATIEHNGNVRRWDMGSLIDKLQVEK